VRTYLLLVVVAPILTLAGCAGRGDDANLSKSPHRSSPTAQRAIKEKTVPVIRFDGDRSYLLQPTGLVHNEKYSDGVKGVVTVQGKRGDSQDNDGPLPSGELQLVDGATVRCSKFRSTIWSDFERYEDMDLICDTKVVVTDAVKFTITRSSDTQPFVQRA
jgi:hypothetical protein